MFNDLDWAVSNDSYGAYHNTLYREADSCTEMGVCHTGVTQYDVIRGKGEYRLHSYIPRPLVLRYLPLSFPSHSSLPNISITQAYQLSLLQLCPYWYF